jgi:small ligand-binding sensory domain FIST
MQPQDLQTLARAALMPTAAPKTAADAIAQTVDMLGALRAVIADLEKQADDLRTQLERAGLSNIEGRYYSATVTQCKGRAATDWATIAKRFKPSAQLIRAYTKTGDAYTQLKLTARKVTH